MTKKNRYSSLEEMTKTIPFVHEVFESLRTRVLPATPPNIKSPKLTRLQGYVLQVFQELSRVGQRLDSLEASLVFMSAYSASPKWRASFGRTAYLRYHNEAFVLNAAATYDRCLQLANAVFELGIPRERVAGGSVLSNEHIKDTATSSALKKLNAYVSDSGIREQRNRVVHRSEYQDKNLESMEAIELLDFTSPESIKEIFPLASTDLMKGRHRDYVYERLSECRKLQARIQAGSEQVIRTLSREFYRRYRLKEDGLI